MAVTLISSSTPHEAELAARALGDHLTLRQSDTSALASGDSAEFAMEAADRLHHAARARASGELGSLGTVSGDALVLLDPATDVIAVALVLERLLEQRRTDLPAGIQDVVAVSSVEEIMTAIFRFEPAACGAGACDAGTACPPVDYDYESAGQLAARLEFASMIVLTDSPTAAAAELALVSAFLRRLAPQTAVFSLEELASRRRREALLIRGRAHRLGATMGWQLELSSSGSGNSGAPLATQDAMGTFVYRDPRPFHPERLHDAVIGGLEPRQVGHILRSRGFVRLASRPERVGSWSIAGDVLDLEPTSMLSWDIHSPTGQEIVFFGLDLDRDALESTLSTCLLDEEELIAGPEAWRNYVDPFPEWQTHHHH